MSLMILSIFVSASNIALNSFLVHAIRKRKKLKILSYWLITCLSVSDIFVGIFGLLKETLRLIMDQHHSRTIKESYFIVLYVESFWINFSVLLVLIIAIDRYVHMKFLMRYYRIMTKKRVVALILFNVIFTAHMVVTTMLLPKYQKALLLRHLLAYRVYRVILSLTYMSFIFMVFGFYVKAYISIKETVEGASTDATSEPEARDNLNEATSGPPSSRINHHRRCSPNHEFAKIMAFVIVTLLICMTPNLSITVYHRLALLIMKDKFKLSSGFRLARRWTFIMLQLNSSLNAAIIIVFSREIRQFKKQFFRQLANCKRN